MAKDSLILLHAPSVYDFRKRSVLWGPVSDLVPSTPIFDMYPIGFTTIAEYLERYGLRVKIINLAVRMLHDENFRAEKIIASLNPTAFGIDLHWLPHAHGALEVGKLVKKIHPEIPIIFGGLSSTYFHEELITYPQVDYILRGDSTEEPMLRLIECIESGTKPHDLEKIQNLTWKDKNGVPVVNSLTYVPSSLDHVSIDYSFSMHAVIRDMNLMNNLPFKKWKEYPIMAALTCKGCTQNCTICGGSSYSYGKFYGREKPAFRSPEILASDIRRIQNYSKGPVFVLGDIRQGGTDYAKQFLRAIQGIENQIILEFFRPVERSFMEKVAGAIHHFVVQLSPESHDPTVLKYSGKKFTPATIESSIENILSAGAGRVDLFFMIGMPGQTANSVMEGIEYYHHLLRRFDGNDRLRLYISPLSPFLDPGSLAFEKPEKYGYKKFCYTLDDHRNNLLSPSWKHVLNYETRWMSRSDIVDVTYRAALKLNSIKKEFGHINVQKAENVENRIKKAIELITYIDKQLASGNKKELHKNLLEIKTDIDRVNNSTLCEKEELDLPVNKMSLRIFNTAGFLIKDRLKSIIRKKR